MPQRCLTDVGGPFYATDKPFRNWSALPYYQLDLPEPPYVDLAQLERGVQRALRYLDEVSAQGYTGIVIDNLAHLVGFERAPVQIYPAHSPYRLRAAIYRAAFGRLFDHARALGMEVLVTTDMQWATPPVRSYVGRLAPDNPRLDEVNRWALEELFATLPQVGGLVVRVGETGGAHDQQGDPGLCYTGHMLYTTVAGLQGLIDTLLPVCEEHDRLLVVRTWSVGIGELGDLIHSPARYRATFGRYRSPHLLISLKHGPADFFRLLPPNPTLGLSGPGQIVELQNRREYELFGMVPSSVAALHGQALDHAIAANPRFAGVWAWNSTGGWGGGTAVVGEEGWNVWTRLSSALTAALVRDPALDARAFVEAWCRQRYGEPFGQRVAEVYLASEQLLEQAWYVGGRSARPVAGLYLPALLWVWWMRPTASLPIWAYLATLVGDVEQLLRAGEAAVDSVGLHLRQLEEHMPAGSAEAAFIVESVRYLHDVLRTAHAIRGWMLRAARAARAGDRTAWARLLPAVAGLAAIIQQHASTWGGRTDFPALELQELQALLRSLQRTPTQLWLQARAAALVVQQLGRWSPRERAMYLAGAGAAAVGLWSLLPRRRESASVLGLLGLGLLTPTVRQRVVGATLPWLSRRLYLMPSIFFEAGPALDEWAA